jgi:hypothetical protein
MGYVQQLKIGGVTKQGRITNRLSCNVHSSFLRETQAYYSISHGSLHVRIIAIDTGTDSIIHCLHHQEKNNRFIIEAIRNLSEMTAKAMKVNIKPNIC